MQRNNQLYWNVFVTLIIIVQLVTNHFLGKKETYFVRLLPNDIVLFSLFILDLFENINDIFIRLLVHFTSWFLLLCFTILL